MSLGACHCCAEPPCAEPVLQFRSATTALCGATNPVDGLLYSTTVTTLTTGQINTVTYARNSEGVCTSTTVSSGEVVNTNFQQVSYCWAYGDGDITTTNTFDYTVTYSWAADGTPSVVYSGTITSSSSCSGDCDEVGPLGGSVESYNADGSTTIISSDEGASLPPSAELCGEETDTSVFEPEPPESDTTVYTVLATPVYPSFPAWFGESEDDLTTGQGYLEAAAKSSGGDFTKIEWRVKHQASGTCYLKAWIRKTFTPVVGSPTTSDSTYEWTGSGNPCLADPALAVDHEDNLIHGSGTEEAAPATNGETTFEIIKFSCVEGYEPDISDPENPQPNGFPDPAWEPEAP